ncbi:MAG TPA: 3-isopropylmalate dehydratase small subunit [Thermomicrobiales bacterium]|nr:3-isopropylmalate dehydratase small subunit [Thermomicrobiales bacterium]
MQPVRVITGTAMPLDRANVDTDQIIPAVWLKRVERTGFGEGLFSAWRKDPSFPLNQPEFAGARILVAGPNFGIGSSREHAVWSLMDRGFHAVISPKFGDIFRNNATKTGLVPVVVSPEVGEAIMRVVMAHPATEITVDVERRIVSVPAAAIEEPFPLDDFTRYRLMEGLDDIGLTLRHDDELSRYERSRASWLPEIQAPAPA